MIIMLYILKTVQNDSLSSQDMYVYMYTKRECTVRSHKNPSTRVSSGMFVFLSRIFTNSDLRFVLTQGAELANNALIKGHKHRLRMPLEVKFHIRNVPDLPMQYNKHLTTLYSKIRHSTHDAQIHNIHHCI